MSHVRSRMPGIWLRVRCARVVVDARVIDRGCGRRSSVGLGV